MPRTQKVGSAPEDIRLDLPGKREGRIILGLVTPLPDDIVEALSVHLQKEFGVPVEHTNLEYDVPLAFNRKRNQYLSPKILQRLRKIAKKRQDKILGIVDVDLYCPDFDFIFGEADADAGVATLSTFRLRQDITDTKLIEARIIKEATHEIGHLFHYGHCDDSNCVMSFSTGNLWQIDAKSASICSECQQQTMPLVHGIVDN